MWHAGAVTRVVFIVLDGLPTRHVTPEVMPSLWALAGEAGHPPGTARGVMPSATYPNHATFVTGTHPRRHGVVANWLFRDGQPVPAESVGVEGRTLFDACTDAGRSSAVVVGDQHLIGVMSAARADHHWPPSGALPGDATLDAMGYLADSDLVPRLADAMDDGHDLLVAQVNGPDTLGHLLGPDADEAIDGYRTLDALVPRLRDALAPSWDETVVIVVSDHTMERISQPEPLDTIELAHEHGMLGLPEGGAALFAGAEEPVWLSAVEGCAGFESLGDELWLAWTEPGWWFAIAGLGLDYRGMHGNPSTLEQLALVTGGHPVAASLAEQVAAGSVTALDWAPTIAGVLDLSLPAVDGRDLLAASPIARHP